MAGRRAGAKRPELQKRCSSSGNLSPPEDAPGLSVAVLYGHMAGMLLCFAKVLVRSLAASLQGRMFCAVLAV